ncbi:hypothetical protein T11_1097, partial [Trichinella zimbabwensis]
LDVKLHVLRRLEAGNGKKAFSIWLDHQTQRCMLLSQLLIMEKAKSIFSNIQEESEDKSEIFTASRGKRSHVGLRCIQAWYFDEYVPPKETLCSSIYSLMFNLTSSESPMID